MTHGRSRRLAYTAWAAVCIVWGTTYLGIRLALEGIPPGLVGGLRYTIAGSVLVGWLCARGERLPPLALWPRLALVGFLLIVIGNGLVIWAEQWVPSGIAAVLVATAPFWMTTMEAMTPGGEQFRATTIAGLCLGFAGIVILVWPDLAAGGAAGRQFLFGVLALQLACVGWSAGSVYAKRSLPPHGSLGSSAVQMTVGGLTMLAIGTFAGEWQQVAFTRRSVAAEAYLIVFGSLIGYSAYVYVLEHLPVSRVSLYAYVNPVIAVVLGALIVREPFGPRVLVASLMVLAGIATVRWRSRRVTRPSGR